MEPTTTLPAGFQVRPVAADDLEAVIAVITAVGMAEYGEVDFTPEDLAHTWRKLDFTQDAWVVLTPEGAVMGYAAVELNLPNRFFAWFYVHPDDPGLAVAAYLVERAEARARARVQEVPPAYPALLAHRVAAVNTGLQGILAARGYAPICRLVDMSITMDAPPPAPVWPPGSTVRPVVPQQDTRAVFDANEEAFAANLGFTPGDFAEWQEEKLADPNFDPALWFLAWDGDQLAGFLMGYAYADYGWVDTLGVRPAWRKQRLGQALLYAAFGAFYTRGLRKVDLGVAADNVTGAPRLYARVGMHVTREYDRYQKELRPAQA